MGSSVDDCCGLEEVASKHLFHTSEKPAAPTAENQPRSYLTGYRVTYGLSGNYPITRKIITSSVSSSSVTLLLFIETDNSSVYLCPVVTLNKVIPSYLRTFEGID